MARAAWIFVLRRRSVVAILLATLLLAEIGMALRAPLSPTMRNGDENIPLGAHTGMAARGDLNTDWGRAAPVVAAEFGAFHYNFSGYVLASYLLTPNVVDPARHLADLRALNGVFFVFTVLACAVSCILLGMPVVPAIATMAVVTFAPGLVHDAEMARPESWLTMLTALFAMGLLLRGRAAWAGLMLSGIALGLAAGTKFTLLVFVLPLVVAALSFKQTKLVALLVSAVAILVGFALAAPYALLNPKLMMAGMQALNTQYAFGHPPHSSPDGGHSFLQQAEFFILLYGLVCLAPLALALCPRLLAAAGTSKSVLRTLGVTYVLFFCALGMHAVFFERNFHPMIVIMALGCGLLLRAPTKQRWAMLMAVVLLAPLLYWTHVIRDVQMNAYIATSRATLEQAAAGLPVSRFARVAIAAPIPDCGTVTQIDYGDSYSRTLRTAFLQQSYRIVAWHASRFQHLPTSTLDTYLDPGIYLLDKPCRWPYRTNRVGAARPLHSGAGSWARRSDIVASATTWQGSDYFRSKAVGLQVIGSFLSADADRGQLTIMLHRGDHLWYRSGPGGNQSITVAGLETDYLTQAPNAIAWTELIFDDAALPATFAVRIADEGSGWGEWSAVAVADNKQ